MHYKVLAILLFLVKVHVHVYITTCIIVYFVSLFISVSSMLNETRQYYTLYNSLEDQREYMEKEVGLTVHIFMNLI